MIKLIDVSIAQGIIDWKTVAASNEIVAAFCKATEGSPSYVDPQFKNNWAGIKANGLVRGAYHFARTQNDPVVEADHFINTLKATNDLGQGDMLVLDIEVSTIGGAAFANWVIAWLERVEQTSNITPIVYTGGPFFNSHMSALDADTLKRLQHFPLWLAAYVVNPDNYVPVDWKGIGWKLWQQSGDQAAAGDTVLHLPGIGGGKVDVDKDEFNGTVDDLKVFANSLYVGADAKSTPQPVAVPVPTPVVIKPEPVVAMRQSNSVFSSILYFIMSIIKTLFHIK